MQKRAKLYSLLLIILLVTGCEKAGEFYLGIPLQPKNINSEFVPGLNIFGILKAGETQDTLNHYFEVQMLLHPFDTGDVNMNDATITIERVLESGGIESYNVAFLSDGIYTNSEIDPQAGETWNYTCSYDTFLVTSSTRIPNQPAILEGSMQAQGNLLSFTLEGDTTAFLYQIYYFSDNQYFFDQVVPVKYEPTNIYFEVSETALKSGELYIFAFDRNYERYITTSNTFFKPNAYRPRFTSVNGGYGCFCSSSSIMIKF